MFAVMFSSICATVSEAVCRRSESCRGHTVPEAESAYSIRLFRLRLPACTVESRYQDVVIFAQQMRPLHRSFHSTLEVMAGRVRIGSINRCHLPASDAKEAPRARWSRLATVAQQGWEVLAHQHPVAAPSA